MQDLSKGNWRSEHWAPSPNVSGHLHPAAANFAASVARALDDSTVQTVSPTKTGAAPRRALLTRLAALTASLQACKAVSCKQACQSCRQKARQESKKPFGHLLQESG